MSLPRTRFKASVFLSYPKPCMADQQAFVDEVCAYLDDRGFGPRTLGVTDYDLDTPLKAIRRLMLESNGIITIAFRRTFIANGVANYRTDMGGLQEFPLDGRWLTSPWAHIEPAMAYQIGLPILILREQGVVDDGLLQRGVVGTYMPEFSVGQSTEAYLASPEWNDLIRKWEAQVRNVVENKGNPPQLY